VGEVGTRGKQGDGRGGERADAWLSAQGGQRGLDVFHLGVRVLELAGHAAALPEGSVIKGECDKTPLRQRRRVGSRCLFLHAGQWPGQRRQRQRRGVFTVQETGG